MSTVTEEQAVQLVIDVLGGVVVEPSRPQRRPQVVERTVKLKPTNSDDPRGRRRTPKSDGIATESRPNADEAVKAIQPDVTPEGWAPGCGRRRPGVDRVTGQPYRGPVPGWALAMYDRDR